MNKSKDFRQRLKNELQSGVKPADAHLDQTIKLARMAYETRRKLRYISAFEMIVSQFRFIARPMWIIQGLALLCLCVFIGTARISEDFVSELHAFVSVSAVFVSMTVLPFFGRPRRYSMCEIESTTRISHSRLMLARLCAVGIGDIVCLAAIILLVSDKMAAPAQTALIFILLPFLLSSAVSLLIMNLVKEEYGIYISTALCMSIGVLYWTLAARLGAAAVRLSVGFIAAVCALLILALILECRRLMKQIPSPDLQEVLIF